MSDNIHKLPNNVTIQQVTEGYYTFKETMAERNQT